MTLLSDAPLHKLQFYITTPYACGYLPNQQAQSLIATPYHLVDAKVYDSLIQQGFRRSGKFAYRPHCEHCQACIPTRVVLSDFLPTRSQKRAFKQHADLSIRILPTGFHQGHFELYHQYQALRHAPDEALKSDNNEDQYRQFLCQSNVESLFIEFRNSNDEVKIVSVVDVIENGISAVYTFYDATDTKASYGTYAILWLAEWAKSLNLPYLYLGYWIQQSKKMAYKQNYKPQQHLIDGEWIDSDEIFAR